MLEQEMASIIKFVIDRAGKPAPYYWKVPAHFSVPSAYFPMPEIETGGETFSTYGMDYSWFVKIFHRKEEDAYSLGLAVVTAIKAVRNLVPLIAEDGSEIERSWVRVKDPKLKILDDGAAQLSISWRSRRPYNEEAAEKMQSFDVSGWAKQGQYTEKVISEAYAEAIERYAIAPPGGQQNTGKHPEK